MSNSNSNKAVQELKRQLEEARKRNAKMAEAIEALTAPGGTPSLTAKVSAKGAVSLYGLGRFPVTLYRSQWERLFKEGQPVVEEVIKTSSDQLAEKPKSKKQQIADELLNA